MSGGTEKDHKKAVRNATSQTRTNTFAKSLMVLLHKPQIYNRFDRTVGYACSKLAPAYFFENAYSNHRNHLKILNSPTNMSVYRHGEVL